MKKIFLTIALAIMGFSAFAQTAQDFNPGWFLGIQGGAGYTTGEADFKDLISPSAALGVGYRFTPVFGLRGALSGWQAKGSVVNTKDIYKWNFAQLNVDAMFDLCNLFSKNKRGNRAVNPYLFAGIGVNDRFNNGAADLAFEYPTPNYIWTGNVIGFTGRFGLGIDFRISRVVAITLEWADNMYSDKFNSKQNDKNVDLDWHQTAMLGLKFNLAREKKVADNSAADAAAEAAAREAAAKAAAAKAAAEKAAAEKAAAEKAAAEKAAAERAAAEAAARAKARTTTECVYYVIEKSNIRESEAVKVQNIINILKQYPEAVVTISGYADKETGTPSFNMKLSQARAEGVAKALVDAGIAPERITVNYYGDTQKVSSVRAENRVSVCVTK